MSPFAPKLVALPATQQALWPSLSQVPTGFVLYGGTALALRLGHRQSVDFDLFTSGRFSPTDLRAAIPFVMEGPARRCFCVGAAAIAATWPAGPGGGPPGPSDRRR